MVGLTQGAITMGTKDFLSASSGVPIVNSSGAAVATNSIWVSTGIFVTVPTWSTATAAQVVAAFTPLDLTPITNSSFTGLFTGNDTTTLGSYPANFDSAPAYILVGNNSTLANSTLVAVYHTPGQVWTTPVSGIQNTQVVATTVADWVYGVPTAVTTQPSLANSAFTTGIQLTTVPEPSAALLGALGVLGLLRRRRI